MRRGTWQGGERFVGWVESPSPTGTYDKLMVGLADSTHPTNYRVPITDQEPPYGPILVDRRCGGYRWPVYRRIGLPNGTRRRPATADRQAAVAEPPKPQPKPEPKKPAAAPRGRSEALTLLATLQREARFVDFIMESLEGYSDAQIGAVARDVHRDCGKVLERLFAPGGHRLATGGRSDRGSLGLRPRQVPPDRKRRRRATLSRATGPSRLGSDQVRPARLVRQGMRLRGSLRRSRLS